MKRTFILGCLSIFIYLIGVEAQCQSETKCQCDLGAVSMKSSSSSLSPAFSANESPLENEFNSTIFNGTETIHNGGSWQPSVNDTFPYFTMDFGADKTLRIIKTKGNAHFNYWIKEYNVFRKTSSESTFKFYKKLSGNSNGNMVKQHSLNPMIRARYIKIAPLKFNKNISLRIDIQGCDKVDGGWTPWEDWRACRSPCGGGVQYRHRSCTNPKPNFLGSSCNGSSYDWQGCNNQTCPDSDMSLELLLPSEVWNNDLLVNPSSTQICLNLESNLTDVYKPVNIKPFLLVVTCSFFQIDITKVGVLTNLTFNASDAIYILKLQVPNAPNILSYVSDEWKSFKVERSAAASGPLTSGFEMFHRLETAGPDGEWSFRGSHLSIGSCDSSPLWCYAWEKQAFHNYTVRIIGFNTEGFGLATDPYRVTTKEKKPSKPSNLRGEMNSSRSIIIHWIPVPLLDMHGNSEGYQIQYKESNGQGLQSIRIQDHWVENLKISGLEEYVEYKIKIRSKNTLYWSDYTAEIRTRTDEDIPSSPPVSVQVTDSSSTSLRIQWSEVPQADQNGVIISYKINVSLGLTMNSANSFILTVNNGDARQALIPNLVKWTTYTMIIAASTIKGTGSYSSPVTSHTSQDRPDVAPSNLRGNATSSTEIHLLWDLIPLNVRHGVITQYHIKFNAVSNPGVVHNAYFTGENTLEGDITGLLFWSDYSIDIAARTSAGYGPSSSKISIRTQEHAPTQPPENVRGVNTSSYSLKIEWDDVAELYRHGVILGYTIQYTTTEYVEWNTIVINGKSNRSVEINGLKNYTLYNVKVSAFNTKGNGVEGSIQLKTEEAKPSHSPSSLLSYNTSSSSIWVEWTAVPTISQRGKILGYFIAYHDIVYNITRNLTIYGEDTMSLNLTGLEEFREYKISVAGINKMGLGPFITTIAVTDEDVPNAAPTEIMGSFVSSTKLKISWSQPPAQEQNGRLIVIHVFYKVHLQTAQTRAPDGLQYLHLVKSKGTNNTNTPRSKRSILFPARQGLFSHMNDSPDDKDYSLGDKRQNPYETSKFGDGISIDFASSKKYPQAEDNDHNGKQRRRTRREVQDVTGFQNIMVNANESHAALRSLIPFMNYTIILQATTIKGPGPLSEPILVQTGEDVPSAPPQNISTVFTSSTSIVVQWLPVPSVNANGIIYAYIVSLKRANSTERWRNFTQFEPNLSYEITGLMKYVVYSIKVSAATIKGSGPISGLVNQRTDEDIPSASPANFSGNAVASTGLFVKWRPVPENGEPSCCLHGIIVGYKVTYGKKYPTSGDVAKTEMLSAKQLSLNIWGLESYSPYTIGVAASTVKGYGPKSEIHIWTLEAKPTVAPQNETVRNKTSTSLLIEWNEMPFLQRKGQIRGYAVYYKITKSNHALSVKWLDMYHFDANYTVVYEPPVQVEYDDIIRRLWYELKGLYKFMEYTIHLTAYTKKGTGPWTYAKFSMTDEDVPSKAAINITGQFVNSTAILVSWEPIPVVYDPSIEDPICCVHGNLTGYTIFYSRVSKDQFYNVSINLSYFTSKEKLLNETSNMTEFNQTNSTASSKMYFILTGLDPHKNYTIYVAGNTRKGHGVWGTPIFVQTDEDVREPSAIRAWNISSTSLTVAWDDIVWEHRNGIILYYTVYYRETLKPWQEEKSFNVSARFNSTVIRELLKWTFYDIRVYGATVKGQGLRSANVTVRTDSDVPTMSPLGLTAVDYTGPYSILIKWKPIPQEHQHGTILSYKIIYFKYSEADIVQWSRVHYEKVVSADSLETYLEHLSTFCTYEIKILGTTVRGDGVSSQSIKARTCRCVKHLYTNWWQFHPYTYKTGVNKRKEIINGTSDLSYVPMGLFPKFLKEMAIWGCRDCNGPRGHGTSIVHFDIDRKGKQSLKKSKAECMKDADEFVDFTFPVQGGALQYKFISDGKFLPFMDHPSSALVALKKLQIISKSEAVTKSILSLWPILLMNLQFTILSGLIYWILDRHSNPEELSQSIPRGVMNGIWWAYVTMTTVGYGDITPRSTLAKLFSVIWMLAGLVLFAILGSSLITALNAQEMILLQPVQLYNNKIAVVNGSFEERLAMLKFASPVVKTSTKEALDMVRNGEIEAALVDTFVLSLHNENFVASSLFVQKTIKMSSFAFGIGLYGNITKLRNVFIDFIHSNQEQMASAMLQYISVKEKGESHAKDEDGESDSMFQPRSPIYKQSVYALSAMTVAFAMIGFIATKFISTMKERRRRFETELWKLKMSNKKYSACDEVFEEADRACSKLVYRVETKLQELKKKHTTEYEWLIHLHKFINRCENEGINPGHRLAKHNISIKNWKKLSREGHLLKSQAEFASGFSESQKREVEPITYKKSCKARKDSIELLDDSQRSHTSESVPDSGTHLSQNLTESSFA